LRQDSSGVSIHLLNRFHLITGLSANRYVTGNCSGKSPVIIFHCETVYPTPIHPPVMRAMVSYWRLECPVVLDTCLPIFSPSPVNCLAHLTRSFNTRSHHLGPPTLSLFGLRTLPMVLIIFRFCNIQPIIVAVLSLGECVVVWH
jgi:hypothetical protein